MALRILSILLFGTWMTAGAHAEKCGGLNNGYGPYDYTNPVHFAEKLSIVERAHFDSGVEALRHHNNKSAGTLEGDIDYTLRAFPNHHKALRLIIEYYTDARSSLRRPLRYTAECYFDRAMRFQPNDAMVYNLHAYYLYRIGKPNAAITSFEKSLAINPNSAESHYNIGLLLIDIGELERARQHAEEAYRLGHPLPGLRRKLARADVALTD